MTDFLRYQTLAENDNPLEEETRDDGLLSGAESSLKEVRKAQEAIEKRLNELKELEKEYL